MKKIKKAQMGMSLPGMTGHMYARNGAPSNGKYAKKTKASAQSGAKIDSVNNEIMLRQLYRESRFKPDAYNKGSKAAGLAQLKPIAVKELKEKHKLSVDPLKPEQAIKAHKKLMTTTFNRPWVDKEDSTIDVKNAKTLAAYNWGPTALVNALNAQKKKGVDIDKTTKWISALPKETQDYINDVTGKNPKFEEEYKKAVKDFKFKGAYPIKQDGGVIPSAQKGIIQSDGERKKNFDSLYDSIYNRADKIATDNVNIYDITPVEYAYFNHVHDYDEKRVIPPLTPKLKELQNKLISSSDKEIKSLLKSSNVLEILSNKPKNISWKEAFGYKEHIDSLKNEGYTFQKGGVIKDDRGQWAHPGKVTQIDSNQITMKNVPYPVLGVSDSGDTKLMQPEQDYKFQGNTVTEYPMTRQDKGQLKKLKQLTEFQKGGTIEENTASRLYHYPTKNDIKRGLINTSSGKTTSDSAAYVAGWRSKLTQDQMFPLGLEYNSPIQMGYLDKLTYDKKPLPKIKTKLESIYKKGGKLKKAQDGVTAYMKSAGISLDDTMGVTQTPGAMSKLGGIGGILNTGTELIDGFQNLKEEKNQRNQAKQFAALSGVVNQAAGIRPEGPRRKYVRPEDQVFDPNQMAPSFGTGSNFLQMKKGGEIQNTYAPKTLYDGLEEAQFGLGNIGAKQLGSAGNALGSLLTGNKGIVNASGQIGSTIGDTIGKVIPIPGASQALGFVGGLAGSLLGAKKQKETTKLNEEGMQNMQNAAFMQGSQNIQNQYSGFMRSGGHLKEYKAPSERAMETYAMGGELQTHWGGKAETVSENPYLPEGGESIEFKGDSHDEGGIGITFGKTPVEVEGGEPANKLGNGLTVFGDMKIPSYGASEIGDPKAKGKKFKNYINDLNEVEAKQNKIVDKGVKFVNESNDSDPFERLKMNSGNAMMIGGNMKLQSIAQKKQMASVVQNAILDTAKEHGLKSDELAKGKFKKDKSITKTAQDGGIFDKILNPSPFERKTYGLYDAPNKTIQDHTGLDWNTNKPIGALYANGQPNYEIPQFTPVRKSIGRNPKKHVSPPGEQMRIIDAPEGTPYSPISMSDINPGDSVELSGLPPQTKDKQRGKGDLSWLDAASAYLPYLRPSNAKNLDPNQLMGEMFALSSNNLEPVQSQLYKPLLEQTSDISYQDQLNENQADFNAIKRQVGNNPAALAALAGQKYQANSKVLGEQFRQNQTQKQGVFNRNRGVLNDATLKNLSILDQQYTRQATAKSNTKAIAQSALSSISDKIAKNKLENKTLGIYENMYNYRFGPNGRAQNWNGLAQFNTEGNFASPEEEGITRVKNTTKWDGMNNLKGKTKEVTQNARGKNGLIVKAMKGF